MRLLFVALFSVLFNLSLRFTTASRGALALSTLPLLTMAVAAIFGVEALNRRKAAGVLLAVGGDGTALLTELDCVPAGAWRGSLLMVGAALTMVCYSVWSRPVMQRSDPITFTAAAMGIGGAFLVLVSVLRDEYAPVVDFVWQDWLAIGYLGVFGGAIGFLLWAYALARTTPTQVSIAVTVNPIVAGIVSATLLGEILRWNLLAGLAAVIVGIWIATTTSPPATRRPLRSTRRCNILCSQVHRSAMPSGSNSCSTCGNPTRDCCSVEMLCRWLNAIHPHSEVGCRCP